MTELSNEMESKIISMEELALQRIFDLKREFSAELESHRTKLKDGLLWNLFIKGIDPPPWLRPVFPPPSTYRDSFNSSIRDDRFSGFGGFGTKRARFNSNVPDGFAEETELEVFENGAKQVLDENGGNQGLGDAQIDGDGGKQGLVDAQLRRDVFKEDLGEENELKHDSIDSRVGRNALKQDLGFQEGLIDAHMRRNGLKHVLGDAHPEKNGLKQQLAEAHTDQSWGKRGKNGEKQHSPHVQVDQNGVKEHLNDAQIGRNIENHDLPAPAQMDMDTCEENKNPEEVVNDSGRGKPRGRARARGLAKERKGTGNVVQSPFVGRMTRARAKQCQVVVSGKELGKRKSIASKQTRNKRVKHDTGVEEFNNVTVRSSTKAGSGIRGSKDRLATSTLEPEGVIPSAMTHLSPAADTIKIEGKSSALRTLLQDANNSGPSVMAMLEAEENAIIDNVDQKKEMLKKSEVKSKDLEQVFEISSNAKYKSPHQEGTSENVGESAGLSIPLPVPRSTEPYDIEVSQQPEISDATDTAQQQETLNAIENCRQHEILDMTESFQLETIKKKQPMDIRSELRDENAHREETSILVEECVEGHQSSWLDCRNSGSSCDLKDPQQPEASDAFETAQQSDTLEAVGKPKQYGISEITDRQADSALALSCHDLQKHDNNITRDPIKKLRSRSLCLNCFKNIPWKDTNSHSKLLACRKQAQDALVVGGEYVFTNQIPFRRIQRLSKKSEILPSQGKRDQNHFSSEEVSPALQGLIKGSVCQDHSKTPVSHDIYRKTSICCSSSFEKNSGKQSGGTGFETNPLKTSLDVDCSNLPSQSPPVIPSVKISGIGCSSGIDFDHSQSDLVSMENAPSCGMHETQRGGLIIERGKSASSVDANVRAKDASEDEQNMFSQMEEATESVAGEKDEPSVLLLQTCDIPRKVQNYDSRLRIFCQNEVSKGQMDTIFDAPASATEVNALLDMNIDLMNVVTSKNQKLFSDNRVLRKEEGLKPRNRSWPEDRKQNALAQEEFHFTAVPRFLQSKSCSEVFEYSNPILHSNANDASLVSRFDWAITPQTSNSKFGKENEDQRNADMMKMVPSEVDDGIVSQKAEVTEFVAEKMGESPAHLKSDNILGKAQAIDSTLRGFCEDESYRWQNDTMCDAPKVHASLDTNFYLMNRASSSNSKLFSKSIVPAEKGQKLRHKSWPECHKQRAWQEGIHSTGQTWLLQSELCSKDSMYNNSVLTSIPNDDGVISQLEQVVTPYPSNSKTYLSKENEEQKGANVMKNPSQQSPREIARPLLEEGLKGIELYTNKGFYSRQSCLTDLAEVKCHVENENVRISPSCMSCYKTKEGSSSSPWLPNFGVHGTCLQVTSNCTSVPCLQNMACLEATPSKLHSFRSSFEVTSPEDYGSQRDCKFLTSDDIVPEFSFQKGLDGMEKCDMKSTPLLKRNVVGDWGERGPIKSLEVNKLPSNPFKAAGDESHGVINSEVGMNISELAPRNKSACLEADCQLEVSIVNSKLSEGVREIPGMQHLIQSGYMLFPTKQTVDSSGNLKEFEGLNHGFSSNDRHFSSEMMNAKSEKGLGYEEIRDGKASFVNATKTVEFNNAFSSLTPAPNYMSKCRIRTPSDVRWPLVTMEPQEHSENSSEFWGKRYGQADKTWANSGFKDVGYGSKIKYSGSLTSTSGMLFGRTATNSMDTSPNLFMMQDEMNREDAGCFPIEEESGFEEESMDLHATVNESAESYIPSMKKTVLGAKNVLLDCSSAKHNSPVMTPAAGRLFQKSSTNLRGKGSNLISKQVSKSQKNLSSFSLEEEAVYGKENNDPCVQVTGLQNRYGSSVKKKVMKNHNLRIDGSCASQISPRSHQKPSNILSNVRSFIPLVQQKKAAASAMTGKRDIKVKALEAAEAAKRQEEKKEQERKMRKELARRGEHDSNIHEKSKEERCKGEKEGEETSRATSDCSNISNGMPRKRLVGRGSQKSHVENSSQPETTACGVDLKLKRVLEVKTKLEQEKLRKFEEDKRRKEEERKKKEAEIVAKKRKREEIEKKEREEKRKRLEVAQRQQKELEEQLRAEKEVKEQRRRLLDEHERKRKAKEEEEKKQRRLEKEKEAAERRRRLEEDPKASKFTSKDAKQVDEIQQHHGVNIQAQKAYAGKVSSMSDNCANTRQLEIEGQSMLCSYENSLPSRNLEINKESYEISPYKGSDEDDDDDAPKKFVPLWARKENLIPHLISLQHIDPDEIFTGQKTCSLHEVFGTDGSFRRRDFNRRSHSGEWLNDKFTWKEEYQYKLQMGYLNKG